MKGATNVVSRIGAALKGIFKIGPKSRDFADADRMNTPAASLKNGYREISVPGGSVFVTRQTEAAYFMTETEVTPVVMNIKNCTFTEANSKAVRRDRFESPEAEFINATPKAPKTEIDYAVFTQRGSVTPSVAGHVNDVSSVEVNVAPEVEPPAVAVAPVEVTVEAPIVTEVPAVAPLEAVVVAPVVEDDAPVSVAKMTVPVEEVVSTAPVEVDVAVPVEEVVSTAPVVVDVTEPSVEENTGLTPAQEIAAFAGVSAAEPFVAETSVDVVARPVYHLNGEDEFIPFFFDHIEDEARELEEFNVDDLPAVNDDGLEKACFKVQKVEVPEEEFDLNEFQEVTDEIPAQVTIEDAAPALIVNEIEAVEPAPVEVVKVEPVVEMPVEPVKVEAPVEPVKVEPVVEMPVEVPVVEAPVVEAPVVEAPVEPVVEIPVETPVESVKVEPVVEMPVEVPVEPVKVEPVVEAPKAKIISRRSVNPADVAAILFG